MNESPQRQALRAWTSVVGDAEPEPMPLVHNPVWRVDSPDGRVFVLRRLPEYPPGVGPVDEYRILMHLQAAGVPVAPPVVTDDGSITTTILEAGYSLLPFIPSDGDDHDGRPDGPEVAYAIGSAIAHLGRELAACPWQPHSYEDHPVQQALDEDLPRLPSEIADLVTPLAPRLRATASDLPRQRTHGDCNTGNVLVVGDRVTGFIDLDHLPIGPRVRDLSYYILSRLRRCLSARSDEPDGPMSEVMALLPHYVAGYDTTSTLTDRERAAIVPLMILIVICSASWSLHGWEPDQVAFEHNVATLRWLLAHADELDAANR